jgi:hypothetical protein
MARNKSNHQKKASERRSQRDKSSGIQRPKRRRTRSQKAELLKRKDEAENSRNAREKELEKLKGEVDALHSQLTTDLSEDLELKAREELKKKLASCQELENEIKKFNKSIEDIDVDLMDTDEDEGEGTAGSESEEDNSSKSPDAADPVTQNQAQNLTPDTNEPSSIEVKESPNSLQSPSTHAHTSHPQSKVNTGEIVNQLFVEETQSQDLIQHLKPTHYADIIDLTQEEVDSPEPLFDDGTVILKTSSWSGDIFLNLYGPKNSAMTVWTTSAAPNEVEDCTYLNGDLSPHTKALRMDGRGKLLHKGMIRSIKQVSWKPKCEINSMLDLLASVEELNPDNKKKNPKYHYPFSTLLVDWKQGANLPDLWISRSNYKRLSSAAKAESTRTDLKIYRKALAQVKNYRDWAGTKLDINWTGQRREGKDKSATPLEETPGPEEAHSRHDLRDPRQDAQDESPQNQSPQNQSPQNQSPQSQSSNVENAINLVNEGQPQHGNIGAAVDEQEGISDFFDAYMEKNGIDLTPANWRDLDDETFASFQVAARVFVKEQRKHNVTVFDDMNFGRAFKINKIK